MRDYNKELINILYDENDILSNSTLIPNIIDEMDLSPYDVRLYVRFKRRVRQNRNGSTNGSAYDSTRTLAKACKMSPSQIVKSKRALVEAGLIRIRKERGQHGEWDKDHITIADIWQANKIYFSEHFPAVICDEAGNVRFAMSVEDDRLSKRGKEAREILSRNDELRAVLIRNLIKGLPKYKEILKKE